MMKHIKQNIADRRRTDTVQSKQYLALFFSRRASQRGFVNPVAAECRRHALDRFRAVADLDQPEFLFSYAIHLGG